MANPVQPLSDWEEIYSASSDAHKNDYPNEDVIRFAFKYLNFNDRVLDLGCGWGNNLQFLVDNGYEPYGIDISPTSCQHCHSITPNVIQGSFSQLPYQSDYFSGVIDRNSIQCNDLPTVRAAIKEVYRVIAESGYFYSIILSDTNKPEDFHAYYLRDGKSKLSEDDIFDIYSCFDSLDVDREFRTFNDGELEIEQYHILGGKI